MSQSIRPFTTEQQLELLGEIRAYVVEDGTRIQAMTSKSSEFSATTMTIEFSVSDDMLIERLYRKMVRFHEERFSS